MAQVKKILVADDHPLFRKGLIELIKESLNGVDIIEAQNGLEAYEAILNNPVDVAILDIDMPELTGLEVLKKAKDDGSNASVVILTLHKENSIFQEAIRLGTSGYLLKEFAENEIITCIQHVLRGERWISEEIDQKLLRFTADDSLAKLTRTERKIVKLIAMSKSSREISELLFVAEKTIENHRSNICRKLELEAKSNGLLSWVMENKARIIQ